MLFLLCRSYLCHPHRPGTPVERTRWLGDDVLELQSQDAPRKNKRESTIHDCHPLGRLD